MSSQTEPTLFDKVLSDLDNAIVGLVESATIGENAGVGYDAGRVHGLWSLLHPWLEDALGITEERDREQSENRKLRNHFLKMLQVDFSKAPQEIEEQFGKVMKDTLEDFPELRRLAAPPDNSDIPF